MNYLKKSIFCLLISALSLSATHRHEEIEKRYLTQIEKISLTEHILIDENCPMEKRLEVAIEMICGLEENYKFRYLDLENIIDYINGEELPEEVTFGDFFGTKENPKGNDDHNRLASLNYLINISNSNGFKYMNKMGALINNFINSYYSYTRDSMEKFKDVDRKLEASRVLQEDIKFLKEDELMKNFKACNFVLNLLKTAPDYLFKLRYKNNLLTIFNDCQIKMRKETVTESDLNDLENAFFKLNPNDLRDMNIEENIFDFMKEIGGKIEEVASRNYLVEYYNEISEKNKRGSLTETDLDEFLEMFKNQPKNIKTALGERTSLVNKLQRMLQDTRLRSDLVKNYKKLIERYKKGALTKKKFNKFMEYYNELSSKEKRVLGDRKKVKKALLKIEESFLKPDYNPPRYYEPQGHNGFHANISRDYVLQGHNGGYSNPTRNYAPQGNYYGFHDNTHRRF